MGNNPKCILCEHALAWGTAYSCAKRLAVYCEHPRALEAFKLYGGKGAWCFISYTAKNGYLPTIKTTPRWCPLKRFDGEKEATT